MIIKQEDKIHFLQHHQTQQETQEQHLIMDKQVIMVHHKQVEVITQILEAIIRKTTVLEHHQQEVAQEKIVQTTIQTKEQNNKLLTLYL